MGQGFSLLNISEYINSQAHARKGRLFLHQRTTGNDPKGVGVLTTDRNYSKIIHRHKYRPPPPLGTPQKEVRLYHLLNRATEIGQICDFSSLPL